MSDEMIQLNSEDQLLTAGEVCKRLRISRASLSRLTRANGATPPRLPHYQIGGRILFSLHRHVQPFLTHCETGMQVVTSEHKKAA
jgi:hypothetical protein